jgi:hypothetical protein
MEKIIMTNKTNPLLKLVADVPTYNTTLPVTKKKVKFRPFLVKEQKVLLLALEEAGKSENKSEVADEIFDSLTTIVDACIMSPKIKSRDIPLVDVEFMFMQLRSKSIGEKIEVRIPDPHTDDGEHGPKYFDYEIPVDDIGIRQETPYEPTRTLSSGIVIEMSAPTIGRCGRSFYESESTSQVFNIVCSCIDSITSGEDVFLTKDLEDGQLEEFVNNLPNIDYEKLAEFFKSLPVLEYKAEVKSPLSDKMVTVEVDNFNDFFV